jgi:hypothetical protein
MDGTRKAKIRKQMRRPGIESFLNKITKELETSLH